MPSVLFRARIIDAGPRKCASFAEVLTHVEARRLVVSCGMHRNLVVGSECTAQRTPIIMIARPCTNDRYASRCKMSNMMQWFYSFTTLPHTWSPIALRPILIFDQPQPLTHPLSAYPDLSQASHFFASVHLQLRVLQPVIRQTALSASPLSTSRARSSHYTPSHS